jgi:hypothetical protein
MDKNLQSPLVDYMLKRQMVWDVSSPISKSVKQVQFTFSATGILGLQIWKPYYFPDDDSLNGSAIDGISVVTPNETNPLITGNTAITSLDAYGKILLWIIDKKGDVLCTIPLSVLLSTRGNTIPSAFVKYQKFCLKDVIFEDCYLTISDTTGINVGDSILFNIFYNNNSELDG